jgi:hypothetical protein
MILRGFWKLETAIQRMEATAETLASIQKNYEEKGDDAAARIYGSTVKWINDDVAALRDAQKDLLAILGR